MRAREELFGSFPLLPREIWLEHVVPNLTDRQDALYFLSVTCKAPNKALSPRKKPIMCHAAASLAGLRLLTDVLCTADRKLYYAAARVGQTEVLVWLREKGCVWDEHTCSLAAEGGILRP